MSLLPFDDRPGDIWYDGVMTPWAEAKLHVLSHSLHFASSVFEGIRVYDGVPFKLTAHVERLFQSARLVDFEIPFTPGQIDAACMELIKSQGIDDGYIRPIAWRGPEFMAPGAIGASVHIAIAAWEWPIYYAEDAWRKGIRLKLADWRRPAPDMAPTQAKASGLYQICTLAKNDADRCGYDDAVMLDYRGFVAETTSSNIFFVIDDKLQTPIADCFLDGITRQTVLCLAKEMNMPVIERHLAPEEMGRASEVFITGTAAEVTPVSEIDGHCYEVGKVTMDVAESYGRIVREQPAEVAQV